MMTEAPDHLARERIAVVETALKSHLHSCNERAEDNTREHSEMKTLIVRASDDMRRDIRQIFARIWWLVGTALLASGAIILAMYRNVE